MKGHTPDEFKYREEAHFGEDIGSVNKFIQETRQIVG